MSEPLASRPFVKSAGLQFAALLLLVFGGCLLLYHQIVFGGKALYFDDIYHNYYVFLEFVSRSLRAGELPVWNPYLFGGVPQIAGLEPPIFYPFCWIFFVGLPYQLALALNLICHHLLAAAGVYLLGRAYGWRWLSASLGACCFSFSGLMVSMHKFHPLQNTVAWLPLVFWAGHRLLTRQRLQDLALFAAVYGLQVLSGHLEIVYFESLLLLAYGAGLLLQRPALRGWRVWALALAGGLLALGLSAIQLLPALLYLPHSIRQGGLDSGSAMSWSQHPWMLPLLLLPTWPLAAPVGIADFFGHTRYGSLLFFLVPYLGWPAWLFAAGGLSLPWPVQPRRRLYWGAVLVLALLLACGKYLPGYELLLKLPGLAFFRFPSKWLVFASLALSLLAADVFDALLDGPARMRRLGLVALAAAGLGLLGGLLIRAGGCDAWLPALATSWRPELSAAQAGLWVQPLRDLLAAGCLNAALISLLLALWTWMQRRYRSALLAGLLLLGVGLELGRSGSESLWYTEAGHFEQASPLARWLAPLAQGSQVRMLVLAHADLPPDFEPELTQDQALRAMDYMHQSLIDNYGLLSGLRNSDGFWPARSFQSAFLFTVYGEALQYGQLSFRRQLEALTATRYILAVNPNATLEAAFASQPAYRRLRDEPLTRVTVWENRDWLPRARFQTQALVVPERGQMIAALADPAASGFKLHEQVLLLDDDAFKAARAAVPDQESADKHWTHPEFTLDRNNTVEVSFETNTPGYLVLADQNLPGWKAYDKGREVPILLANYMQRAVRVGPGKHRVRFEYQAPGFIAGAAISGLSLLILIGLLGWRRSPPRPAPEPPPEGLGGGDFAARIG